MAKVKVKVLNATIDGKTNGETLELEKKQAEQLEKIGYVEIVKETPKKTEEPKKPKK